MLHLTGMIENAAGNEMENGKKFKVQSSKMGPWPAEREQSPPACPLGAGGLRSSLERQKTRDENEEH